MEQDFCLQKFSGTGKPSEAQALKLRRLLGFSLCVSEFTGWI